VRIQLPRGLDVFGLVGYLLERVPPEYLTVAAFDAAYKLVHRQHPPPDTAYKNVLFNFCVWSRADRGVQLHVCQRLYSTVCRDRDRVSRAIEGAQPVVLALHVYFGYAYSGSSPDDSAAGGSAAAGAAPSISAAGGAVGGAAVTATVATAASAAGVGGDGDAGGKSAAPTPLTVRQASNARVSQEEADTAMLPAIRKLLFMIIGELVLAPHRTSDLLLVLHGLGRLPVLCRSGSVSSVHDDGSGDAGLSDGDDDGVGAHVPPSTPIRLPHRRDRLSSADRGAGVAVTAADVGVLSPSTAASRDAAIGSEVCEELRFLHALLHGPAMRHVLGALLRPMSSSQRVHVGETSATTPSVFTPQTQSSSQLAWRAAVVRSPSLEHSSDGGSDLQRESSLMSVATNLDVVSDLSRRHAAWWECLSPCAWPHSASRLYVCSAMASR
jgi:hypothetical protein